MPTLRERLSQSPLHPRWLALRELRRVIAELAPDLRGTLLDVGCGRKPYAALLTGADRHFGVDRPSSMHGPQAVDAFAGVESLPFPGQTFDSILCTEVLEHVPDPRGALREMGRVLRPGGTLLLTVPLSEQLHEEPWDFYRFTHHALERLLRESSFRVRRVERRGGIWAELGYRLSSALYNAWGSRPRADGTLRARPFLGPPIVLACAVVQLVALACDRLLPAQIGTIGYAVLAEREPCPTEAGVAARGTGTGQVVE